MLALVSINGVYPKEATEDGHSPSEIPYNGQYTVDEVPNPKTNDANAFVANPDGIISEETVYQLNTMLQNLEAKNKAEIAVVVLNSIGDNDIFDFDTHLSDRHELPVPPALALAPRGQGRTGPDRPGARPGSPGDRRAHV